MASYGVLVSAKHGVAKVPRIVSYLMSADSKVSPRSGTGITFDRTSYTNLRHDTHIHELAVEDSDTQA